MTKLLLIARRFPYNSGEVAAESYLETEIGFLAEYYDEILVVATEASTNDVTTCFLPPNVCSLALGCTPTKKRKIILAIRGVLYTFFSPDEVRDAVETDPVTTIKQWLFRGYFAARAHEKYKKLVSELKKRDFEPVNIYCFWLYDIALVASWLQHDYPCVRVVSRAHGYDLYSDRTAAGYLPFRKFLFSKLNAVLSCSRDGEAYIDRNWPNYSSKVRTSYLGTAELANLSTRSSEDKFRIVSCSRVIKLKRVGLLASALSILDAKGIRLYWTHYGDGPELAEVKKKCSTFSSVVAEFPGSVSNKEILHIYETEQIDLFINVSRSEGLPLSIMEACGVGMPVLATDVGGTHEIVRDGINGILLSADSSPAKIALAIEGFMNMPKQDILQFRQASRSVWENHFRAKSNICEFVRILKGRDSE